MAIERVEPKSSDRRVRDVMTANPECVTEQDSVRDAARIMQKSDTGVVPVVDGKKIIGLITDRDIVVRLVADGKDLTNASVRDVMTKNVRSVRDNAGVSEVLDLMSNVQVRRVPVVNVNDELVGIVSMRDLANEAGRRKVGETIREISDAPPNN